jgi:hypothetical protein
MSIFDDLLVDLVNSELGEEVAIVHGGTVFSVRGIVSRQDQTMLDSVGLGVTAAVLVLEVAARDLPAVAEGDQVTIGGRTYEVVSIAQPDAARAGWRLGLA